MAKNGKSNSFLIGRIYEKTEQTAKILPAMQKDLSEMKEKQLSDFYEIKGLKRRVRKIETTSLSCVLRAIVRFIFNMLLGRANKP